MSLSKNKEHQGKLNLLFSFSEQVLVSPVVMNWNVISTDVGLCLTEALK